MSEWFNLDQCKERIPIDISTDALKGYVLQLEAETGQKLHSVHRKQWVVRDDHLDLIVGAMNNGRVVCSNSSDAARKAPGGSTARSKGSAYEKALAFARRRTRKPSGSDANSNS